MGRKKKQETPHQVDLWGNPIEVTTPKPKTGTELIPAEFENQRVRIVVRDGQDWWVAADVCRVLGISNARDAIARLDEDEKTTVANPDGGGHAHTLNLVNQFGLFTLILTSRKPDAKRFKRWVTHEVLPAIRKYGTYSVQPKSRVKKMAKKLGCDESIQSSPSASSTTTAGARSSMSSSVRSPTRTDDQGGAMRPKKAPKTSPVRLTEEAVRWARIASGYTGESMTEYVSRIAVERGRQDSDQYHDKLFPVTGDRA
jgi:prophage antirepressor-like protein